MQQDMTRIGRVLRAGREAKGMTQAALAAQTRIALRTIIAIENDQRYPTFWVFYKLVRALDLSADQIIWPEKSSYSLEQEQVIREFLKCSETEQSIIIKIMRILVRSMRECKEP